MSYHELRGDLFAAHLPAIGHGVNCAGRMARGIAVEFASRWPDMYRYYQDICEGGALHPGDVMPWHAPGIVVFNLATQEHWRKNATLEAISRSVQKAMDIAHHEGIRKLGIPRIGAGLGGLDWADVSAVIKPIAHDHPVALMVYEYDPATAQKART